MTQLINYQALNDFLDNQTDDSSSVHLWYERLSEYDLDGTESPQEMETLFQAMKFLMSFSFTSAEELREVAEREAAQMAEKEEAWEEQKMALKEELDTLRERITVSADAGDSSEAFRAQIDSLREENRELEKANRDRDREMADLRDRFESLVSKSDVLTRERDALEQHRNQMEDTIRELQRRISAKSEETTNEWESRKLRQRNEQAVTLTRQMQAIVLQNDELREEVTRVGDALEEATRVINESASRYAELTALHEATQRDLRNVTEENEIMRQKLEVSSSMLMAVETEAMDTEQTTAAKMRELMEDNRELRDELYATRRELEKLREIAESINYDEKEAELEKLRTELIEATKTARSLYGEMTSKTASADPTVSFQLRIMQLETHLEQANEKVASQKKAIEELEETLVSKDEVNSQLSAELERIMQMKFGDAREEVKRLMTQISFRDTQISQLTNLCTMLQIELANYEEQPPKPLGQTAEPRKEQEIQTVNGSQPDVVPQQRESQKKKPRKTSKSRPKTGVATEAEGTSVRRRVLSEDVWEQQAMLIASLYSELMFILEEQEVKQKQMSEMETVLANGRRAMDDAKSQLKAAYEEIYRLKKVNDSTHEPDKDEETPELLELGRFASTIRSGGSDLERRVEEMTRKLINEQIERIRLSRSNTALRRRSARAEQLMRRARDRMVVVETQAGKRCAQLQYQLDTALIDLAECQGQLVRSVPIEKYEKLALRYKKECVAEVLGSELDEVWKENVVTIAAPTDAKMDELEAKNSYLKKIVEVLSEQNDFWSKETEILQNENEELKRFVEDMENESDLKNILASIEQRLLETIREQQEGRRDHEREFRKAREAEESLAKGRREWTAERTRLVYAIKTLQTALSTAQMNSLNALSLPQIEKLKAKIREVRENELEVDETKSKVESIQNELEQQLIVQKSIRKAREGIAEDSGDVAKLERRLQAVYGSLELQTIASDRMKNTLNLRDRQLSELRDELDDMRKENEQLLTAIASSSFFAKVAVEQKKVDEPAEPVSTREPTRSPTFEEPFSSRDGSEASSTDSDGVEVKTILQDNSKDFEKQLVKMKEAAEICIQNYKNQLLQKEEALRIFRELAEKKLAASSRPIVEKEIIREEVRVKDEETEERLRQSFGEVARLKEELEELERANRELYRKQRRSVITTLNTVECQTDVQTEDAVVPAEKEMSVERNESSRNSPGIDAFEPSKEKKWEAERARYKNDIKQLQGKLRRLAANNKELLVTCEKIREDALAEMEAKAAARMKEPDEQAMLKIRFDLEKIRKENKTLRKTVDEQKSALEDLKKRAGDLQKSSEVEISKWNERKKLEENLNSVKKKLSSALEREKELEDRVGTRDRVIAELRRDEELRLKELDRCQRRIAQIQSEKEKMVIENTERVALKSSLKERVEEFEKKVEEVSVLSMRLHSLQDQYSKLAREYERTQAELEHRERAAQRVQLHSKAVQVKVTNKAVTWASTQIPEVMDRSDTQTQKIDKAVEVRGTIRDEQSAEMKLIVAMDDTLVFQLRETKKNMEKMGLRLLEMDEKLADCERDRDRLLDANKRLVEEIGQHHVPGAVAALCEKLEAKNREIILLKTQIRSLEASCIR
uniref:Nucleoprotein TPR n=1 Tax=Haemonchus contortus TaxID=6289 RepID=A0A7I4XX52_HAECO